MHPYRILYNRGVTRLCHFTNINNLRNIFSQGILATSLIKSDIKNVTDPNRYDGNLDYVCCSIQYPNSWYLSKIIDRTENSKLSDWVVLGIDPTIFMYKIKSKFSTCNASKDYGVHIIDDMSRLKEAFASECNGFQRSSEMLNCCPTDGQTEILINSYIPTYFISYIFVPDKNTARKVLDVCSNHIRDCNKKNRLSLLRCSFVIAEDMFTVEWRRMVENGQYPTEIIF